MEKQQFFQGKFLILIDKISAISASIKSVKSVVFCVKIGKMSAIFQSKTLIPQNKNNNFQIIYNCLASIKLQESRTDIRGLFSHQKCR